MTFTVVSFTPTVPGFVWISNSVGADEAQIQPVLGYAVLRDVDTRAATNVCVPVVRMEDVTEELELAYSPRPEKGYQNLIVFDMDLYLRAQAWAPVSVPNAEVAGYGIR